MPSGPGHTIVRPTVKESPELGRKRRVVDRRDEERVGPGHAALAQALEIFDRVRRRVDVVEHDERRGVSRIDVCRIDRVDAFPERRG